MNKRTRLIVSLLFVVLIILAAAITRFYLDGENNPVMNAGNENAEKVSSVNADGYSIFSTDKGVYGISESGRILAAAEWNSLEFAGDGLCIASKKVNGRQKYGCIDFDGNIAVPLIYSRIEKKSAADKTFYCGYVENDEIVLYDEGFNPCFTNGWKSCTFNGNEIRLESEKGSYLYNVGDKGLLFGSANFSDEISGKPVELNIYSRVLLSKLTPAMIEKMTEFTDCYISYAFGGDEADFKATGADVWQFGKPFAEAPEILEQSLEAVPELHIYSVGTEDGVALYDVSVSADVNIEYTAEDDTVQALDTQVKAAVRFRGNYETDLEAVSGSFEPRTPDYPQEETTVEATTQVNQAN